MPHIIQHHFSFVNTQMMLYEREFAGNYDVRSERGAVRRASALRVVSGEAFDLTFFIRDQRLGAERQALLFRRPTQI